MLKKKKKHTVIPTIGGHKWRNGGTFDKKLSLAIPTIGGQCRNGEMSEWQHVTPQARSGREIGLRRSFRAICWFPKLGNCF